MKGKILAVSIVAFAGTALAEEAISIYQLDGSIHCQAAEVTTPAQAAETLEQALVVDAGDWNKMLRKRPDAHGFGVWLFDRPEVEVYKYDGSLQCGRGKEISLQDMARELTENGIEVKGNRKGSDGRMHIAMCGASNGRLNVYSIATESLPRARELGFELLVTRQMTREIGGSAASWRGPALSRTPPRAPGSAAGRPIPQLW